MAAMTKVNDSKIIAQFNNGDMAYLSRSRIHEKRFTTHKNQAWRMPRATAEEIVSRCHAVKEGGVYHQEVSFYFVSTDRATAKRR